MQLIVIICLFAVATAAPTCDELDEEFNSFLVIYP